MSHPLFFRGKTFFYPTGNTSAIRLTENLPPEQQANILLLACGDPRHILYTVYTNETDSTIEPQKLDITCCDVEAAVLARNALLFTFLADDGAQDRLDGIWNIFHHLMIDQNSLSLLIKQCRKLVTLAQDLESWQVGPYSQFLSVCNRETLSELHRIWSMYLATADYNPERRERFKKNFLDGMKGVRARRGDGLVTTSSRSAGPAAPLALDSVANQFRSFWSTGVTDDGLHSTDHATFVNPTFAFSMAGEKFAVHYGTDPVSGYHLAEVFAANVSVLSAKPNAMLIQKMVQAARTQFSQWCAAVIRLLLRSSATSHSFLVRMFVGDALMLCNALCYMNVNGVTATPVHISPWTSSTIEFEEQQYGKDATSPAPSIFNVIDTSNVSDHVGLLNLLTVTTPLLTESPSATLYTEALLPSGDTPSQGILERLCGDIQTMSLLLGVIPSAFLSQFTTRSNIHETFLQVVHPSQVTQYHERIAWKAINDNQPLFFQPDQLAGLLFGIYLKMFSDENMTGRLKAMSVSPIRALRDADLAHYTRRSFVQLLHHIKSRIQADWTRVMVKFDDKVVHDSSLLVGSNYYQEMCCHFHLLGIVTFSSMEQSCIRDLRARTKPAIFQSWEAIPAVVTVVLVVPRGKITAVAAEIREAGTPILQCDIRNMSSHNVFAHISAAYGKLQVTGTGERKRATIVEDKEVESTSSPLVVSFSVPSFALMMSSNATLGLSIRSTPNTTRIFLPKLGIFQSLFTAQLEDTTYVHVLAEPPTPNNVSTAATSLLPQSAPEAVQGGAVSVQMDESCSKMRLFTVRVDVTDPAGQASLAAGSAVSVAQVSAHETRLCIAKYEKIIGFPLPVDAANAKLRIARKSMYIEVIIPPSLSTDVKSEHTIEKKFSPVLEAGLPVLRNVHRINLDRCPPFKLSRNPGAFNWFVPHVSLMFSNRERVIRGKQSPTVKDTLVNLKDTLHTLLLSVAGVEGNPSRSVFALRNTSTQEDLVFIFVTDLRLDVGSHTVLADAWITPGTSTIQKKLKELNLHDVIAIKTDAEESEAWRHLLPVLTDRCRTWTHKPTCEYLAQNAIPLFAKAGSQSPFCSCGVGVGTEPLLRRFRSIASYATRAAISPLFAVSYLERVGTLGDAAGDEKICNACGKEGSSLSVCGKCKKARYCSRECQVGDWKVHKKNCV
ncbi:hypothetical protein PAXINDRAFT_162991 [Paxillus involutus ATCC 200175]|uniref:Unplaced genomic scaffold PAXINscaffold_14, whole genome shotgun sequence n=1 Tax=Paxillus involutus ATCC 200175 TaxID=664439 RepID=A0A0C9SZB8_PAXIN|nr:hypothetical protein PAXINDRAFT_162991 [Paxillus involutus ATCC 200175]